jgi:hypothetical protein
MSQDTTVTNFVETTTTDADTLIVDLAAYGKALTDLLYEIDSLDAAHKAQIRSANKTSVIKLRGRLELLSKTLGLTLQAPDI